MRREPTDANQQVSRKRETGRVTTTIATANVNGIRAAIRRGMDAWLDENAPDIVTMQEVRAPDALVTELVGEGWHIAHSEAAAKGRSGVAVIARVPLVEVANAEQAGLPERFWDQGRWIEATVDTTDGTPLTICSAYVHTGDAGDEGRMEEKFAFVTAITERYEQLRAEGRHVLLTGDLNIAHRNEDIKNWKGNVKKAGFLPEERERLTDWFESLGWVDLGRRFGGEGAGPYSWWSWRGQAFDNDSGWRIDYLIATPDLAATAKDVMVGRAASYDARWSDHAPVTGTFDLTLA
ncbi:MAG: exodeoxyribonuclease III [Actinobacteria bacterium]|nr:exodeoxyribonuclease III [Actinomycetota bacterium]